MKNCIKYLVLLTIFTVGVSLTSCKKDTNSIKDPEGGVSDTLTFYDVTDVYPGTSVVEIEPSKSTAQVHLQPHQSNTDASKSQSTSKGSNNSHSVVADVPVQSGSLITDDYGVVGGFVSLDFNNVMTSPTGNVVADADVIRGNLIGDDADGIMDVHINSVEELDDVLEKDGIQNTHMMKGVVKLNGKTKDFEVPVDINKLDDKFELVGIVDFDRSHFYSDEAFNHLTGDDLLNDKVKVKVHINSKGTAGKMTIYDATKNIKEKVKFKEHGDIVTSKIKEKGDGFKDKDKIMEHHDKEIEKLKEKEGGEVDKEKIREVNGKTVEKLTHHAARLERHKEKLVMQQDEIKERYKDKDKETGAKEIAKLDEKIDEIDVQLKSIDEEKNKLSVDAQSTDGGLDSSSSSESD